MSSGACGKDEVSSAKRISEPTTTNRHSLALPYNQRAPDQTSACRLQISYSHLHLYITVYWTRAAVACSASRCSAKTIPQVRLQVKRNVIMRRKRPRLHTQYMKGKPMLHSAYRYTIAAMALQLPSSNSLGSRVPFRFACDFIITKTTRC